MTLILLVAVGAAVAGFVQGLSGFAFGLVAMAFWAWVLPPQLAAPMVVFGSLMPAMIIPTLIGARAYASIDDASFRKLVLILLTVSGLTLLAGRRPRFAELTSNKSRAEPGFDASYW